MIIYSSVYKPNMDLPSNNNYYNNNNNDDGENDDDNDNRKRCLKEKRTFHLFVID